MKQDVFCAQCPHVIGYLLHAFGEDVSLASDVEVKLDVIGVYPADLSVHLKVVVSLSFFVLIRMQQMLFALKVFVYLAVYFDVLKRTMEHNEDLGVDCPVIQIRDVAFKGKL